MATSSKNSSFCSDVIDEKKTVEKHFRERSLEISSTASNGFFYLWFHKSSLAQSAPTSVGRLGGVRLGVAPPPCEPALQIEGAALVVEPPAFLQGAEQLIEGLWEVRS